MHRQAIALFVPSFTNIQIAEGGSGTEGRDLCYSAVNTCNGKPY
jgi:hypothetical protein